MLRLIKYAFCIGTLLMFFATSLFAYQADTNHQKKRKLNYPYTINHQFKNYPVNGYPVKFNLVREKGHLVNKRIPIKTPFELQKSNDFIYTKEGRELKSQKFKELQGKPLEIINRVNKEVSKGVPGVLGILTDSLFEVPRKFITNIKNDNDYGRVKISGLDIPEVLGRKLARNLKDEFYQIFDNLETNDFMGNFVLNRFAKVLKNSNVDIKNGRVVFDPKLNESFSGNLAGYKIDINGNLALSKGLIHPSLSIGIAPNFKTNYPFNIKVDFDGYGRSFACKFSLRFQP